MKPSARRVLTASTQYSAILLIAFTACAGRYEAPARRDLAAETQRYQERSTRDGQRVPALAEVAQRGELAGYVALALQHNPEIQAAFERWAAGVMRISRARQLPEPTLSFGYFLRSVETRVGPQHARLSLQQAFPWPTKLSAGADAASARARALQRRFEAQAVAVRQRVAAIYWSLWQVRTTRTLNVQHLEVLRSMSESIRARIATGTAALADLQQLDLSAARLNDNLRSMDEAEQTFQAQLCAELGLDCPDTLQTHQNPPPPGLPEGDPAALQRAASEHPLLQSSELLAQAADASAEAEQADRLPSFTVGADWIITGETTTHEAADMGKDALLVGAGIRLPLWQGSYADSVDAARAEARGQRAERAAQLARARAALVAALSSVRDSARRVELYRATLVPQAESAYESVLGTYTVGRGSVTQVLMAQRELLELRVMQETSSADHARAWARLEEVTGRELRSRPLRVGSGAEAPSSTGATAGTGDPPTDSTTQAVTPPPGAADE